MKKHIRVSQAPSFKKYFSLKRLRKVKFGRLFLKTAGLGLAFLVILVLWFSKDLPTPARIAKKINTPSTQILDRNGNLLYAVSQNKKRFVVPMSEIPDNVKNATIALEDHNFYQHHGVDVNGVLRSTFINATTKSQVGGSTITQQFVKNALLTSKKSYTRKIKEAILAVEMEAIYSKDKILELYLNEIPYGSTSYGIESASRTFLGKPAKDLTLAESAVLAALPQRPSYFSPYGSHRDALLKRKDFALDNMVKYGYIKPTEADEAKKQEIKFQDRKDSIIAPHFVFYVQELVADKFGEEALQNGGLKIKTTLDIKVQKMAEDAIKEGESKITKYNANNAALVSVDPKTGEILAMVGSKDYFNSDIQGQVNVTTANRQPGSSFKPLVYVTAFKGKFNPASPIFDLTTDFGGGYKPSNYDGRPRGPVSIRTALSNSLNISAVKMLSLVGNNEALKTAEDLGITTLTEPKKYGLALVLGAGEVKPVELAGAYATFGNEGKFNKTNPILSIEDHEGKILEENKKPLNKQVLDPQAAYLISDVLSDNEARRPTFGFTNALTIAGRRVAVKTGTTSSNHDAWTVGYTPQISTAVWVGNTDNKEMKAGADGSIIAAPIWNSFMKKYLADKPKEDFKRPGDIKELSVDFFSNKLPSQYTPSDQLRKDIFASWQVPTERDDIHIVAKVNKANGKLATDLTPPELIEERVFTNIHSERPDNPNWENPVRTWAAANNLNLLPPKDTDNDYDSLDKRPAVSITSPEQGTSVNGSFVISADAAAYHGVSEVIFILDGSEVGKTSSSPYQITLNTNSLTPGDHVVSAKVSDKLGATATSSSITFSSVAVTTVPTTSPVATNPQGDTTGPTISGLDTKTTSSSATFTWDTNEAADGQVEYGITNILGSSSIRETSYSTRHTIAVGGLLPKTTYYYRVNSRDQAGNITATGISTFQTK